MFESFISDLLNRILGIYIEDLDGSKLKISMWGGNVQLNNLVIKQTALDELNLPVRPLYGHLESLSIKIPWNKLYTEKWEAVISGFSLLAVPVTSIIYDEENEKKLAHDVKMATLEQIELAKKKSILSTDKPKDDGFIEKLISQIVRNIQVTITDIHIRYEDPLACQEMPFSVGVVLQNLSLQSTDANWNVGLDTADFAYKLMSIDGFAIYLTPRSALLSEKGTEEIPESVKSLKFEDDSKKFKLVLGPLNLTSKLQLNLKPELNEIPFSVPKVNLCINLETLSLALSRYQFTSIMSLLDSLDRAKLSFLYKKYRPSVRSVSGNARLWWKYIYNCKLDNIRRIRKNWSWNNMKAHRDKCREYMNLYKIKLSRLKLSIDDSDRIVELEDDLDVFNIVLTRKQAEMEVAKATPQVTNSKASKGWFSSWFYSSTTAEGDESEISIAKDLRSSMDEKDKAQLYEAIGYSQNGVPAELPEEYVDVRICFCLQQLTIAVLDELLDDSSICTASLDLVESSLERRFAAAAIKITTSLQSLNVRGIPQSSGIGPLVVESLFVSADTPLLSINLETIPLDGLCDIRLHVNARPLNIIYDSATIHHARDLFVPPKDISLQQLQAAAVAKYEVVKEKSVTGLQNAIDLHSRLDLNIKLETSRLVLTQVGKKENEGLVVMTLGSVAITSNTTNETSLTELAASGKEQDLILAEMRSSSYEHFTIIIEDIQIIAVDQDEDWASALTSSIPTTFHLLQRMCLRVDLYRCLITTDPFLPKIKIIASLPEIYLSVRDVRIIRAAAVLSKCLETNVSSPSLSHAQTEFQPEKIDHINEEVSIIRMQAFVLATEKKETVQFIDFILVFKIQRMALELLKEVNGTCTSVLKITSSNNSVDIMQKTFSLSVNMKVEAVSVKHLEWSEEDIVSTYSNESDSQSLVCITFKKVSPKNPLFHKTFNSTTEHLDIDVSRVSVRLEQRVLLNLLAYCNNVSSRLEIVMAKPMAMPNIEVKAGPLKRRKSIDPFLAPAVKQNVRAYLKQIDIRISSQTRDLLIFNVKGLEVFMSLENDMKTISTCLDEFSIINPSHEEFYKEIFILLDKRAWSATVKLYETTEEDYFHTNKWDVEIEAEIGRWKVVLLYKIVADVLSWLDNFQAAKDALLSASQAAVQVAKQNIQDTYLRCTKIRLALVLEAPIVIIPNNSSLNGGLIVDLGKIVIKNKFRLGSIKNKLGQPCLFDDVSFSIENVEVSRKVDFNSEQENEILYPLSLILFVKRNLSVSWHKLAPEMDVNANLKAVKVAISDGDIKAFYSILNGNLSEVSDNGFKTQLSLSEQHNTNLIKNIEDAKMYFKKEDIIFNRIIFQFSIQAITLDMFTTEIEPLSRDKLFHRNDFAKFELQSLSSKLFLSSNSDLTFNLQVDNCVLRDTREGANGIVTLLEKKSTCSPRESSICEMSYFQQNEKTTVNGKVAEFLLVLHLPFLLQLREILMPNLEENIFQDVENVSNENVLLQSMFSDEKESSSGFLGIHLKIEKPDIVFVEDLRDINSSSIFLHGEIKADMEFNSPKQMISSKVCNLEMYVACFNEEKRKNTMSCILEKSDVTFSSYADDQNGESSQIKFGRLKFIATPDYVALLMNIVSCLTIGTDTKSSLKPSLSQDWTNYWEQKHIDYNFLSFLNIDVAEEALESALEADDSVCSYINSKRTLTVEWDNILLSMEAGSGQSLVPLLKLQISSFASIDHGDNQYEINGHLNLEVVYFNSKQAIWEPLLEPIENSLAGIDEYRPWQLQFMAVYNENNIPPVRSASIALSDTSLLTPATETSSITSEFDFTDNMVTPQAVTYIRLVANDPMEFTVTNTSLEVLVGIQEAFMEAYSGKLTVRKEPEPPYKVMNKTGITFTLYLNQSNLRLNLDDINTQESVKIYSGAELRVYQGTNVNSCHRRHGSLVDEYQTDVDKHVVVRFADAEDCCFIPSIKTEKRFFSYTDTKTNTKFGIVSCVSAKDGCKTILLSSCVEIVNKIDNHIDIYAINNDGNQVDFVCSLKPDEKDYLPVHSLFTPSAELFFGVRGYSVCVEPLVWKRLVNQPDLIQELRCNPKNPMSSDLPFVLNAVCDVEQILWSRNERKTVDSIMISIVLRPWMQMYNLLPVAFGLSVKSVDYITIVHPGESTQIDRIHSNSVSMLIEIFSYEGANWLYEFKVQDNPSEFSIIVFKKSESSGKETLHLVMHKTVRKGVNLIRLFSPFWLINKTGHDLTYKGESSHTKLHRQENKDPILFMFRSNAFIGKNRAVIKLGNSDWSQRFPLDTIGSSGSVTCQAGKMSYKVSVDIQLSTSGLTKIVTFSSFYKAINRCPYDLEFLYTDNSDKLWQTIGSGECICLWPVLSKDGVHVRVKNTLHETSAIHFQNEQSNLFKLSNMFGGVLAEVKVTEGGILLSLDECVTSISTVLVINQLNSPLMIWQETKDNQISELDGQKMIFYPWESAEDQILSLSCFGSKPISCEVTKSGRGIFDDEEVGWASFVVGAQYCLLVSRDEVSLEGPTQPNSLERPNMDLELMLKMISFSLVNDKLQKELLFIVFTSSDTVWEHKKKTGKKWRPFTDDQITALEKGFHIYKSQVNSLNCNEVQSTHKVDQNLEVNYALMESLKPFPRKINRVYQAAVWLKYSKLSKERNLHLKVNSIQIDNQLFDVKFPVIFSRTPQPNSILSDTVPKPFLEFSVIESLETTSYHCYKYLTLLIQEFNLQLELPFLYAIMNTIFPTEGFDLIYTPEKFKKDSLKINESLANLVSIQHGSARRDYYHYIHLSPIKMHLGFSVMPFGLPPVDAIGGEFITNMLLHIVGVPLLDTKDAVFRLGFFEKYNYWMNLNYLMADVISHYTNQILKQLYVFVLGLDVLGNPYGLVLGVTKGFEDLFYEPIQGAVEGPGEFAEGLKHGVQSFMGKTVGGAAGAFSKITGTIGKGVASLTLDDAYQKQRRDAKHRKPSDELENMARAYKGLFSGVTDGVTGIFTKPIEGAKEQGVEGFFNGLLKGGIGLVTKPVSGVVDFASESFDAVVRVTDTTKHVTRFRPSRFIGENGIVRPYSYRCAEGAKILRELEKGQFTSSDHYVAHSVMSDNLRVFLVTTKRLFVLEKSKIFGQWKIEFVQNYVDFIEPPLLSPEGIRFAIPPVNKGIFSMLNVLHSFKVIKLNSNAEDKYVYVKLTQAYMKVCSS